MARRKKGEKEEEEDEYACPVCGGQNIYMKQTGEHCGLYCSDCNIRIKWLNKQEIMTFAKRQRLDKEPTDDKAVRVYRKHKGVLTVRCGNCKTKLYTSNVPAPQGQFNLINAKYCPVCGKEFI